MKALDSLQLRTWVLSALAFVVAGAVPLSAENVFITSFKSGSGGDVVPCPHSCSFNLSTFGASSASASTASPTPVIPASSRRVLFGVGAGAWWSVQPSNAVYGSYTFTELQNTGTYKVYVTKGQSANASTNIITALTVEGAQLFTTNGTPTSSIDLDVFQASKPNHVWVHIANIINERPDPKLTFTHTGGECHNDNAGAGLAQRWYADAVWFEYVDVCTGVAAQLGVNGPLTQGQTFVTVNNVTDGATNVTVFADGGMIGETNRAAGFSAGTLTVPTTGLTKGTQITARQTKNGCNSPVPGSGPVVGGGPNATVKAFLSLWQNAAHAGPIGANTFTNLGTNYFIKSPSLTGFGTAPNGGQPLPPGTCWQVVTFDHAADDEVTATGIGMNNPDPFCALAGLLFTVSADDPDTGPYEIYVDQIMNGDVVIEDFESYAVGTTNTFSEPRRAAAPNPVSSFLSAPNLSVISTNNAFSGTKSCRIQWQWVDAANTRWVQVLANASTNSGKYYPQLDVSKPITVRYLVLPVGQTLGALQVSSIGAVTNSIGANVTLSVSVIRGTAVSYQWKKNGVDISGANQSSYTINNAQTGDAGAYSVVVSDGTCNNESFGTLTIQDLPPTITYSQPNSTTVRLTWTGTATLQQITSLSSTNWQNIEGAVSPYDAPIEAGTRFYRLRR